MMMRRWFTLLTGLLVCLSLSRVGWADPVIDWNNITLDEIRTARIPPPRATRVLAMVHTAVFDAVNGIEGGYQPYFVTQQAPPDASAKAAAATAAYQILWALYPERQAALTKRYHKSIAKIPNNKAKTKGALYGAYCAKQILKLRQDDGADATVPYAPSGEFGRWQPTPPNFAPALLPNWPYVTPFAVTSADDFLAPPPPAFDSRKYAKAYNEVREYGAVDSALRTPEQTLIAYFWEDGPGTVTPPGHWQVIAQQLSAQHGLSLHENARLFALLSITQADAAICAWNDKYTWDHVRPYTAITQEADDDGNPDTSADPTWESLLPTPPFPAYISGHSTFSGGSARLLARFFGADAISFCAESPDPGRWPQVLPGVVRCWDKLSQAVREAGQSRIYGGIHWQYDNQAGLVTGRALADYVFEHFLRSR